MLRGKDVQEIEELKRQGLSIRVISRLTGYDRKTIGRYLIHPEGVPVYGPRAKQPGKLDPFQAYLKERMQAGVRNARVLLRELRERNYTGGYTLLTDWLRPQRDAARTVAVRRFETPPGKAGTGGLGSSRQREDEWRRTQAVGLRLRAALQPDDDGRSSAGPEVGNAAADARGSLSAVGRSTGGDPL
jgi:hypothetical protein